LQGSKFEEVGTPGLEIYSGYVRQAYNAELYWPSCAALYDRIWRSDPEVAVARLVLNSLASKLDISVVTDVETPTDDDKRAEQFGNEALQDIEGGITRWLVSCMTRVPFYGWGWWEAVPGLRRKEWRAPGSDPWRSEYDDGLVGYRRLAFRNYPSFFAWDIDDETGHLQGMTQLDTPRPSVTIPLERSLHVVFGDMDNPEGLATMEAMWRLERIKYALEQIQGIGFEHSAGHAKFTSTERQLTSDDHAIVRKAARAILTAQEGNYLALPSHLNGEIMDVPFQAAAPLLDAVRYYGILKLALLGMQWAALGTLSPYGSYSSMQDASQLFITIFNSMTEGFIRQADAQIIKRLFEYPSNAEAFPGMTKRPVLKVEKAEKIIGLGELSQFIQAFAAIAPLSNDDMLAIRRKSDFLPEVLPKISAKPIPVPASAAPVSTDEKAVEMQARPLVVTEDEQPTATEYLAVIDDRDIALAVRKFEEWAEENEPQFARLLRAQVIEGEDDKLA
jgi:hypothetical protein